MYNLLLVDDDPNVLRALMRTCRLDRTHPEVRRARVHAFVSPYGAAAFAAEHAVDLVLTDYRMPSMNGAQLLARIREGQPDVASILLTGSTDPREIARAINGAGICRFVPKPWDERELTHAIADALAERAAALQLQQLAELARAHAAARTREERALRALEAESPGITRVRWSDDGGVIVD